MLLQHSFLELRHMKDRVNQGTSREKKLVSHLTNVLQYRKWSKKLEG
jgi:hypothetical protein